jgi:pilus assembly protein Flp/PilA
VVSGRIIEYEFQQVHTRLYSDMLSVVTYELHFQPLRPMILWRSARGRTHEEFRPAGETEASRGASLGFGTPHHPQSETGATMNVMMNRVRQFLTSEDGPTAVEYAVMLALIIVACIGIITTLGTSVSSTFSSVNSGISGS